MDKKRKYDELSQEGPLTQLDVKYFKKQAIWRQMNYYKKRYQAVENVLESYKQPNDDNSVGLIKEIEELNKLLKAKDRDESESIQRVRNNVVKTEVPETSDDQEVTRLKTVIAEYEKAIENMKVSGEVRKVEVVRLELIKDFNVTQHHDVVKSYQDTIKEMESKYDEVHNKEVAEIRELLNKNEKDLVRIRNVRDDLLNKISVLEVGKPNEQLIKLNEELVDKLQFNSESDKSNEEIIRELEESYKSLVTGFNIKLKTQVEQDNLIKKYQIEKTKADQKYFQIMKLKDSMTNENKLLKMNLSKLGEINQHQKTVELELSLKINKLQDLNQEFQNIINNLNITNNQLVEKSNNKTKEMKKLVEKIESLTNDINDEKLVQQEMQKKINLKELEMVKMRNGMMQANGGEELNGFRSMVKCSVCSKNWKNTVLTVCGHVFCDDCVKQRLDARLRRCPSCNKGFSHNDTLAIHL